jgi:hypothetical protein
VSIFRTLAGVTTQKNDIFTAVRTSSVHFKHFSAFSIGLFNAICPHRKIIRWPVLCSIDRLSMAATCGTVVFETT